RPPGTIRVLRAPGQAVRADRGRAGERGAPRRRADRRGDRPVQPGHRGRRERAGGGDEVTARIGVVTFPGTLDDVDAARAVRPAGAGPVALWHASDDLKGVDAIVVPGGFSYGDYLRAGAIAALAPVVRSVVDAARAGTPVLGICNGFQILCEAHLLPGALVRNERQRFVCREQRLRVASDATAWTSGFQVGDEITVPLKNGEGRYVATDETLDELAAEGGVVFEYAGLNPNGSLRDIAG